MFLLALALGCNGKGGEYALEPFQDDQNYAFSSTISAEPVTIGPGNATMDWSGLTTDLLGRDIDPATQVVDIQVVRYETKTVEELLEAINSDSLAQSWVSGYVTYVNDGGTSAEIADFDFLGTPIDPDEEIFAGPAYLFNVADPEVVGYRGLGFFVVDDASDNHTIELTPDSADLEYTVDISGATKIPVGEADSHYADWTLLTTDSSGAEIRLADLDQLMLAHYTQDLSELEADFLNIETLADEMYLQDISGLPGFELYDLVSESGDSFGGFTADGTWLIALRCTTCINPAPPFLGVFEYQE